MDCYKQAYEDMYELIHMAKCNLILAQEYSKTHPSISRTYAENVSSLINMCEKLHNQLEEKTTEYEFEEKLYLTKMEKLKIKKMLYSKN